MLRSALFTTSIAIASIFAASHVSAAFFQGLGHLPSTSSFPVSQAHAVSADGSVVVGYSSSGNGGFEAFRWTLQDGLQGLGDFPGGLRDSRAWDLSADGEVIVGAGNVHRSGVGSSSLAFRWSR